MYQKDYLLFMIEQFGRLLRRIVSKIAGGDFDDASYEIEQIYRQYLGINSDLIPSFSYDSLMMLQSADPDTYHDRCITLADMLRLEGEIFAKNGGTDSARGRYHKALGVYLTIFLDEEAPASAEGYREHHAHIDTILEALAQLDAEAAEKNTGGAVPVPDEIQAKLDRFRAR
ncbi:MAG: hypothetical protein NXI24_08595 [bacterium]|nr:hypothetical protein [bacterium]